jgi:hypothetical protein
VKRCAGLLAALLLASGAVCAQQPAAQDELVALRVQIVQMIGRAPCANLVHCRVLPLGVRPCGGPAEYLAYSSITADKALLENKAFEYSLLQEDAQRAQGAVGTCEVLPQPRLACVNNSCRIEH